MRIVIADDHPLYLDAARQQAMRVFRKAEVCATTSLAGALELLSAGQADLVMLDYSMPGTDGLSAVKQVVAAAKGAPVVVMSGVAMENDVYACIQAGAKGFLPKTLDGAVFAAAVSLVASGGTYVPTEFIVSAPPQAQSQPGEPKGSLDSGDFSERELALLKMVVAAASNKEIARAFDLQEVTVKFYLTRIFRKMGVKNRSHAAVVALRSGLISET
ncbi:MAG TPA: response regulator transcription factor [Magnetospirillum sp.]|nr:response regulator transcription factor [Magnetospirillum sp.]